MECTPKPNRTQIELKVSEWLARQDRGALSQAERAELQAWLEESAGHKVAYIRMEAMWGTANKLKVLGSGDWRESPYFKVPGQSPNSSDTADLGRKGDQHHTITASGGVAEGRSLSVSFHHTRHWATAAAVLVVVGLSSYGVGTRLFDSNRYTTPVGGTASVPMPDGSKVTLNTNSEIRIAVTASERRIDLQRGEAFFVVAKDLKRPFVVLASDRRVTALGTQFSVRRDGGNIRVAVTEGTVKVENLGSPSPDIQLMAGSIANADKTGVVVQEKQIPEVEDALSWRTGCVVFHKTPLADAVAEFNRYSERKIVIQDPAVAAIRIGGNFRTDNVDAFLRLVQATFPVNVIRQNDRIVLTGN